MFLIRSLKHCLSQRVQEELRAFKTIGVTLGNFDGMHRGHQALFSALDQALSENTAETSAKVLLTFLPHPNRVITKSSSNLSLPVSNFQLTTISNKISLASSFGFDFFFRVKFSLELAKLTPEEFVYLYLCKALSVKYVVVGYDWTFGYGRSGAPETLRELGYKYGFNTIIVPAVSNESIDRVSSTIVREKLLLGDLEEVSRLLGRHYEISGRVHHGLKRGHILGYPTANLAVHFQLLPPNGVYASQVFIDGNVFESISNIGVRPTFGDKNKKLIETYILVPGEYNLYGKRISVRLLRFVRSEIKFNSVDELNQQMKIDCAVVLAWFASGLGG